MAGAEVSLSAGELSFGEEPEVVLTDSPEADATGLDGAGIVRIGGDGPADVHLPADCMAREVCLACSLLAQVVRFRRREHVAAELHRKLSAAALTDPLTGLANRRAWDAALAERLARAAVSPLRLCLAILDLDHFKRINDGLGHTVGDAVLREAARAVYDSLRHEDFVARLGGDEFGLLLWVPDEAMAARVVERVRAAVGAQLAADALPPVTASAGYRLLDVRSADASAPPPSSPTALFTAADDALHEAKRAGRNRTAGEVALPDSADSGKVIAPVATK